MGFITPAEGGKSYGIVFMLKSYSFLVCFVCFFGVMIPINDSLSSLFKGTFVRVYTLGFGLVLLCIRDGSNNYMPGNDFFPPVYMSYLVVLRDQLANV